MGWMTLHSASVIYPDNPTEEEKQLMNRFLDLFAETITCQHCQMHFTRMLLMYRNSNPEFLNSKRDFFLFVARAHNTVNKRLDKPSPQTVSECLETLRMLTANNSPRTFRENYIVYLIRNWAHEMTGDAMILKAKSLELQKINDSYLNQRDIDFNLTIEEGDVLREIAVVPIAKSSLGFNFKWENVGPVGFQSGKLRLNRK